MLLCATLQKNEFATPLVAAPFYGAPVRPNMPKSAAVREHRLVV